MSGSNVPQEVTLKVNINNANLIMNALTEQPWRIVNELINDLRKQLMDQINPRQEDNVVSMNPGE